MLPKSIRSMLQTVEIKGYKLSNEYALKQARELRNERAGGESQGGEKAAGGQPLDRLDHLEGHGVMSEEDAEAVALAKKGKSKGFKGWCFNCGKTGHKAADCWAKGGGKEGQKGQKGSYGKGPGGGFMEALFGPGYGKGKGAKGKSWGKGPKGRSLGNGKGAYFVDDDGWNNWAPQVVLSLNPEEFSAPKKPVAKSAVSHHQTQVETRNRFSHLSIIKKEEPNEDIPLFLQRASRRALSRSESVRSGGQGRRGDQDTTSCGPSLTAASLRGLCVPMFPSGKHV